MGTRGPKVPWHARALAFALFLTGPVDSAVATPGDRDDAALLRSAVASDDLALATLAARIGDDAVLAALAQHEDVLLRVAALRSTPHLRARELALPMLAELAGGRDPDLAPAAARRLIAISQALALDHPSAHEYTLTTFADALARLSALAQADGARRDVRVNAGQAAYLLRVIIGGAQRL